MVESLRTLSCSWTGMWQHVVVFSIRCHMTQLSCHLGLHYLHSAWQLSVGWSWVTVRQWKITAKIYTPLILVSLQMYCLAKSPLFPQLHIFHYSLCICHQIWGNNEPTEVLISSKQVSRGWIFFSPSSRLWSCGERHHHIHVAPQVIFGQTENVQAGVCHTNISQRQSCSDGSNNVSCVTVVPLQHP